VARVSHAAESHEENDMEATLKWITTHRRGAALALALSLTIAAGIATRALATKGPGVAASSGSAQTLFAAQGPVSLSGELEGTKLLRGGDGFARLELAIAGRTEERLAGPRRVPTDVLVILDRSGSMEGEKIEHARAAVRALLRQLGPDDRFALASYASEARIDSPLVPVTAGSIESLEAKVDRIAALGGTNLSSGLDLGLGSVLASREPGRAARVIVISDGLANEGDSSREGLIGRVRRAASREWVVTAVGVGEDFDESLMSALADAGTGNFYYLDQARDLAGVFAREFDAARATIASALEIEVTPAAGVRVVDAAGYPLETRGSSLVFSPGALFAGQERRIWLTLAVSEDHGEQSLGKIALHYDRDGLRESLELPDSFRVAWAERPAEVAAALAPEAWSRSVSQEAYGALENRVAEAVKSGERDRALSLIDEFESKVGALNGTVQSAPVAKKLEEAKSLRDDVSGAFDGAGQAEKQNRLSKAKMQSGYDKRRAGAKAQAVTP
jgi:Ca-activated chloride channel family protein